MQSSYRSLIELSLLSTENAVKNLSQEGIASGVHLIGDIMYDVLLANLVRVEEKAEILDNLGPTSGEYIHATIHSAGNVDGLRICALS